MSPLLAGQFTPIVIQQTGGTMRSIAAGIDWVGQALNEVSQVPRAPLKVNELVVGTICGGSDATSGISANPAVGRAFDLLVKDGAATIFEETGEMIGFGRRDGEQSRDA